MTQDIFRHWIKTLDNKFRSQNRQILMLLDNASSHLGRQLFDDLSQPLKLTNITIRYLPPNTTSHLQPMDQGIINNFKVSNKLNLQV